jgi:hypothetical protein
MNTDLPKLAKLATDWRESKRAEENARDARLRIEQEILEQTGCKEEGSQTHDAGDWRITVTGKLKRKLNADKWREIEDSIPEALRPVEYKPALDTAGLRCLENNEPDIYRQICQAIETKPAKPSITIK